MEAPATHDEHIDSDIHYAHSTGQSMHDLATIYDAFVGEYVMDAKVDDGHDDRHCIADT